MTPTSDRRTMQLDPHILDFLQGLEAQSETPIYTLSPADARNVLLSIQRSVDVTTLPVDSENRIIRGGPTSEISLRIVRPQSARGLLPGVMYFHGGGWILGDKETHVSLHFRRCAGPTQGGNWQTLGRSPLVVLFSCQSRAAA
ncbi:alpha/beta hydrolase [Dictyobacter formicarum]|uniref:Alpha/beta hydrolase fold-3 domain-containing protein n=1 Tax=Dictyobacter formicarum TaxID=2778368 RepID=A0ABQ3VNK7_9CHLR|nr:hypothetical protein [Dictyobacter formicarum]GHO86958.1 hypothetical protein KSZ_49640 [Dictyobacter formicarum]